MFFESDNIVSYSMLDLSRAMSPVQAGIVLLLLIVNEVSTSSKPEGATDTSIQYLCISTLLSHLTHIIAGFFLFCAIIVLALIIYQPVSLHWSFYKRFPTEPLQPHRNILLVSFTFAILFSQGFINVQFIRLWYKCMKPVSVPADDFCLFWQIPGPLASKHQKALWVASMGSIVLSLYSLGTTILVCIRPCLWDQLTTVCPLITTVPQSLICFIAPSCRAKPEKGSYFGSYCLSSKEESSDLNFMDNFPDMCREPFQLRAVIEAHFIPGEHVL